MCNNVKFRPSSIPLFTIDPYFSVWSNTDNLNDSDVVHWTGMSNKIVGKVKIDSNEYVFMGKSSDKKIEQVDFSFTSFSSDYVFRINEIELSVSFLSPVIPTDLYLLSRPVVYMNCSYRTLDSRQHKVELSLYISEELCLNYKGENSVEREILQVDGIQVVKMGNSNQNPLNCCGDNVRINWGYFYLATESQTANIDFYNDCEMNFVKLQDSLEEDKEYITAFAYDDIYCLKYFGKSLEAYWKKFDKGIVDVVKEALNDYSKTIVICSEFHNDLYNRAEAVGGSGYANIVTLALRQIMAAHKLALDENGELVYISKECFSNGCAATVDVTYPSCPFFLLYNTKLLEAMLRPVMKYALSDEWKFEFAPHDVGVYPFVEGQKYYNNDREHQMPIEECGNMLILVANIAMQYNNADFCKSWMCKLEDWAKYLIKYGVDPENQLCTDDFAGHLAHNCNLSVKAIMGIMAYSKLLEIAGDSKNSAYYMDVAKGLAQEWIKLAKTTEGHYKHTFDKEDGFSLKYNMVWDKLWKTDLFGKGVYRAEIQKYLSLMNEYGVPLDQRKSYTKSDWMIWAGALAESKEEFEQFANAVCNAYSNTESRVPMPDWYDSITAEQQTWLDADGNPMGFQARSVQGGLYLKLLLDKGE